MFLALAKTSKSLTRVSQMQKSTSPTGANFISKLFAPAPAAAMPGVEGVGVVITGVEGGGVAGFGVEGAGVIDSGVDAGTGVESAAVAGFGVEGAGVIESGVDGAGVGWGGCRRICPLSTGIGRSPVPLMGEGDPGDGLRRGNAADRRYRRRPTRC